MRVPERWKEVNLTDLSTKISDGLHSTPSYVDQSDYFFINGNNLKDNKIVITENTKCVSEDEYLVHKKELGERTILMSINGTIGNIAYYSGEKVVLGKSAAYINLNHNVDKDYIFFYLASNKSQRYFESELTGTTIRNLSLKTIKATKIALPTLHEQQKIAQILSTWDKAIEKLEALIAAKQKRKKALMQQLLTGKKRFAGFEGEWQTQPLAKICKIVKGEQLNRDTLSEIGSYPVINGGITPSGYGEDFNREPNTITISEGGNSCGFVNLIRTRFWSGGHCYALENVKPINEYLYQSLKLNEHKIMRLRVGSGLPNIQKKDIEHFHLDIPNSKEEQQKIASVLSAADSEIHTHQKQLSALKEQKKGLMQQLLTGKTRVKVEAHV